jgi:hypothetical protein
MFILEVKKVHFYGEMKLNLITTGPWFLRSLVWGKSARTKSA